MRSWARFVVTLQIAWRNLFNHKAKNLIVGLLMAGGTMLVVMASSLFDSLETAMQQSVTGSIAGDLQVYDANARDELALFGGGFMGAPDIGTIADFGAVKRLLTAVDNVEAVIPMGIDFAEVYTTTELDHAIADLKAALEAGDAESVANGEAKIRAMAELLEAELVSRRRVLKVKDEIDAQLADVRAARSDEFWADLRRDPAAGITNLDTKIAPLVDEAGNAWLNYIGTDLDAFVKHFGRFELVSGQLVPSGARGILINQHFYDQHLRNKIALMFDTIDRERRDRGETIAADPLLANQVKRMARQYRRITFQLDPPEAKALTAELRALMPEATGNLDDLVQAFLTVDDANFDDRKAFFEQHIVPRIQLYAFDVGDVITIRAFTSSGYLKSVNLKVYGTFAFKGLEESALAGAYSLMDMMTFRDLYGMMTPDKRAEIAAIKEEAGVEDVTADEAEAALFGEDSDIEGDSLASGDGFDALADLELSAARRASAVDDRRFDPAEIDQGVALNAAIILTDPTQLAATRAAVDRAIADADLELQTVDWMEATGMVGQLVVVVKLVLFVAIFVIFIVAIVIMNNTMVMATAERQTEIGTMRAIGGRRGFVLRLFVLETLILGAIAGLAGALLGLGVMTALGASGVPAPTDELIFLFSGPRLYPTVELGHLAGAFVLILIVSLVATFYPALLATRIQPVIAMQARE